MINGTFSSVGSGGGLPLLKTLTLKSGDLVEVFALDLNTACTVIFDASGNIAGNNVKIGSFTVP